MHIHQIESAKIIQPNHLYDDIYRTYAGPELTGFANLSALSLATVHSCVSPNLLEENSDEHNTEMSTTPMPTLARGNKAKDGGYLYFRAMV